MHALFFGYEVATWTHEESFLVCNVYLSLHVYLESNFF